MTDLSDRLAVVTGGGGAIGSVAAELLADLGAHVIVCGRSEERLALVAERRVGRIEPFAMSVAEGDDWGRLVAHLEERWDQRATVLVTAAGINHREPFLSSDPANWQDMWSTNVAGTMHAAHALLDGMLTEGFGRIVCVSSVGAHIGLSERCGYAATKGAVEAFARSLAMEVATRGVTVNCIAPGAMPTELNRQWLDNRPDIRDDILRSVPAGRFGDPEELRAAFEFLLRSPYSQASTVIVDGGWTAA